MHKVYHLVENIAGSVINIRAEVQASTISGIVCPVPQDLSRISRLVLGNALHISPKLLCAPLVIVSIPNNQIIGPDFILDSQAVGKRMGRI